jgi:toxin ParE1/3/4
MRIRWTPAAADDLQQINDFLADHNPQFSRSTILELYESVRSLRDFPYRGRVGREEGTRELVLPRLPYIVAYRVKAEAIEVLHIFHTARRRS